MRRLITSKIFLLVVSFFLVWIAVSSAQIAYKKHQLNAEIAKIKDQIAKMESENSELKGMIDYFKEDSNLEQEIRQRFNMKKPDEEVVIVGDLGQEEKEVAGDLKNISEQTLGNFSEKSNAEKWWSYFFEVKK